jgi:hypothetical protein
LTRWSGKAFSPGRRTGPSGVRDDETLTPPLRVGSG